MKEKIEMDNLMMIFVGVLEITMLDLVLSADNIGVIALATKNLPEDYAKRASVFGIMGAVGLRIFFASIITYIMMIQWLPIKLVGGLLLVKITWDLIKPQQVEEENSVKGASKFWGAVVSIIIADVSMSLDNVLAIAGTADGSILLIVLGIAINIPILFFGSKIVGNLMRKYGIVVYIGAAILAHTSIKMILEDRLLEAVVSHRANLVSSWFAAVITLLYGIYQINKANKQETFEVLKG
jgi:YjbE family integral membrane protein